MEPENILSTFKYFNDNVHIICPRVHKQLHGEDDDFVVCWSVTDTLEHYLAIKKVGTYIYNDEEESDSSILLSVNDFLSSYSQGKYLIVITYDTERGDATHWFAVLTDDTGYAYLIEYREHVVINNNIHSSLTRNEHGGLVLQVSTSADMWNDITQILSGNKPDSFYGVILNPVTYRIYVYTRRDFTIANLNK